ncbi:MAG TPA: FecR domain-containing protein [Chitinophagaceae bacterium]|nr:FecR domain-containing protein [Chitinophagaceae bacterium]
MVTIFKELLEKYKCGNLSLLEKKEFSSMLKSGLYEKELEEAIDTDWNTDLKNLSDPETLELIYQQILISKDKIAKVVPIKKVNPFRWKVAAAILIITLGGGTYFFFNKSHTHQIADTKNILNDIKAPASNKAMITLGNGKQILLDSAADGTLATEKDVNIIKQGDGQIVYKGSASEVSYNTLTNPRGSKVINLTLADGSKVWLNAESSLKYPTAFIGNERKVEITGEAYFKIAHNPAMPFKVKKDEAEITVLGTHFNVNAYTDEVDMKVTLLEGSVRITKTNNVQMLLPGQQASINENKITLNKNVDLEQVMAWKNGRFQFEGANIKEVMREISRWYNVEVVYEGKPDEQHFRGGVSRDVEASKVFKMLETTGAVHFKIEGNKIVVMP